MRSWHFLLIFMLSGFAGCGRAQTKTDPSREFVSQVEGILWKQLRQDELTSVLITIERYRQFGLKVKALPDGKVNQDLAKVAREWADASIEFSNVLIVGQQIQSNDNAVADGAIRLILGEAPASVWERADSALKAQQRWDGQLEIIHTRMTAAQTDFFRVRDRLIPDAADHPRRVNGIDYR